MKTRVISGLIMVPFLGILFLGDYILLAATFLIGISAVYEFYKGFHSLDIKPCYPIAVVTALLLYGINVFQLPEIYYFMVIMAAFFASALYLFNIENRKLEDGMATLFGIIYIIGCAFQVALVEQQIHNFVWLIIWTAFGTDVFAYFSGFLFGKHKLCPKISPKKTIEGSIGGTLGSVLLCGIFGHFVIPEYFVHCLIIGVLGGIVSQLGDLTASIFKRKMGIKDYGSLIPGHGGILDRFDSVLFTAPLVFSYIVIVINGGAI